MYCYKECRARLACTYVQSDLALHSPLISVNKSPSDAVQSIKICWCSYQQLKLWGIKADSFFIKPDSEHPHILACLWKKARENIAK